MPHADGSGEPGIQNPMKQPSLGAAVRVVSLLTIGSRVGGLARDMVTARVFADTLIGSAFAAAFAVPNIFRRLFGEGALAAAFLPEYAGLDRTDPEAARRFASRAMRWLVGVTGLLTVLVEAGVLLLLFMLPANAERDLSLRLLLVTMPFMPMVCAAAILAAMLQAHGRFAPGAAAPLLLNGALIVAAVPFLGSADPNRVAAAYWLSAATLVAGAAQVLWMLWSLRPITVWTRIAQGTAEPMRRLVGRFGPVLLGLGTIQLNSLADTLIAMWPVWVGPTMLGMPTPMDKASNSILTYTQRLYQFPLGVFGIAVATAAFPMLARSASDPERFLATLRRAARLSLFIAVPASVGLALVREDLVAVVFTGGGGFSEEGARRSQAVLIGYAVAVWAYSLNHVSTRAFYARGDTRTPMLVALGAVACNLALNLTLIWWLREAGLAWATGMTAVGQCAVLVWIQARRVHPNAVDAPTLVAIGRILLLAAAMGGAVIGVLAGFDTLAPELRETWAGALTRLAAAVATGGGVYLALAILLRLPEPGWLAARDRTAGPRTGPNRGNGS